MYQDQERTTPYGPPQTARVAHHIFKHGSPRLVIFAAIVALLGLALGAASLTFFLSYRSTATAQIRQLQQAVANAQADNQSNTSSLSGLSGKVSTIDAGMAALAPYSKICSTDLTGPSGPAQFYFACTDQRPAG
jgi:uncharacterized protein HemX